MNHQQFEEWVLAPESLSDVDRQTLTQHLEGCASCQTLKSKWTSLAAELRSPEILAPRAGFSRRWKAGIAERQLRDQRRQAWRFFLSCAGAALGVFLLLVGYFALTSTPGEVIHAVVGGLTTAAGTVAAVRSFTSAWVDFMPPALNLVIIVAMAFSFIGLTFTWVFAIYRTAFQGVWNK